MAVYLSLDTTVGGLKLVHFYGEGPGIENNYLNLRKHTLLIGGVGIINDSTEEAKIVSGNITSATGVLRIASTAASNSELFISSVIRNYRNDATQVDISSYSYMGERKSVALGGSESNTFTGTTTVSGRSVLRLKKTGGARAIQGDLVIHSGAAVELHYSHQINQKSDVRLQTYAGEASEIVFRSKVRDPQIESIHKLTVQGKGRIDFGSNFRSGNSILYIDDLEIMAGSRLIIANWEEGHSFLYVNKGSIHLEESLERIEFTNGEKWGHLVDAGNGYYLISNAPIPEPVTYGAIFGAASLGLWAWRRQARQTPQRNR